MPHIALPENMPGITAGFAFRPETAKPLRELAHILLHTSGDDGFSSRDRELVAAFVSSRNTCYFCQTSHGAAASHLNGGDATLVAEVCRDYRTAAINDRLKALLAIAEQVQIDGKRVTASSSTRPGATELQTVIFTTRCSSPPLSACTTAMSMALQHGSREKRGCTSTWESAWPNMAIHILAIALLLRWRE